MKKNKINRIRPDLLSGFRDYLPELMIPRQKIIANIRKTFESFGFLPLDTPGLERSAVLGTDKDEFRMEVYRFDAGKNDVTLRFDLTVPLSRVVAAYPGILKPFKRYQYGPVWRKERPQAGRYREFTQFDADTVGSDSVIADAEIVILMYQTLKNLGLKKFVVRFNNRKILNGLPDATGFERQKAPAVFRILDKLDKIGFKKVAKELARKAENEFDESAVELSRETIGKIQEFLSLSDSKGKGLIKKLKRFFRDVTIAEEGIAECEKIISVLENLDIPRENWRFDLSIARGLGYYTGPVFETTLTDIPEIGSVFSGGRYDDLVMRYTGNKIPATGASVGVDRLIAALEKLGKIDKITATAKVLLTVMDNALIFEILILAQKLRQAGINAEIYLGEKKSLKEQIIYAAKRGIPFVIIMGPDEMKIKKAKLKDMEKRQEFVLTEKQLIAKLS